MLGVPGRRREPQCNAQHRRGRRSPQPRRLGCGDQVCAGLPDQVRLAEGVAKIFDVVQKHKTAKGKFIGSKVPFPTLTDDMQPEAILKLMPVGSRLRLDRFNGRWHAFFRSLTRKL